MFVCLWSTPSAAAQQASGPGDEQEPLYVRMTDGDIRLADDTVQSALESRISGTTVRWRNRASGNAGSVTPLLTYRAKGGFFCRQYEEILRVGADAERYEDVACRGEDGIWQPLK